MRILVISNLGPQCGNLSGGAFLPTRLRALQGLGHRVTLTFPQVRFQLGRLKRPFRAPKSCDMKQLVDEANELLASQPKWNLTQICPSLARETRLRLGESERVETYIGQQILHEYPGPWDLVQAHGMYGQFPAGAVAAGVARERDIPFTVTMHGSDIKFLPPSQIAPTTRVLSEASARFFVSEDLRKTAVSMEICSNGQVTPNGVDLRTFSGARERSTRKTVCFVGNLIAVKGADRLPAVMREIWKHDPAIKLDIVGVGGLEPNLKQQLNDGRVSFRGYLPQEQLASVLGRANALLMPSRSEGFPCVSIEAQAMGVPVVATAVGGLIESVGGGGELVSSDPFQASEMAAAALRQMDKSDQSALRSRAEDYSWEALAAVESRYLEDILSQTP